MLIYSYTRVGVFSWDLILIISLLGGGAMSGHKPNLLSIIVLTPLLLIGSSLHAAESNQFYITPSVGYYDYDSQVNVDDEELYGIGFGFQFNDRWATELSYFYVESETDFTNFDADQDIVELDLVQSYKRRGNWQTYSVVGLADRQIDISAGDYDDTLAVLGTGVKQFILPNLSLRYDARLLRSLDEGENDFAFSIGLSYAFGGGKTAAKPVAKQPEPAVAVAPEPVVSDGDDDEDGVVNSVDQCPNTDRAAKVDRVGCYIFTKEEVSITLNVQFDTNSANIRESSHSNLSEVAEFINDHRHTHVLLEGHTDSIGASSYNKDLSQRRADSVRQALIRQYGISPARLTAFGHGEDKPIASNDAAEGRQQNRRVVAVINSFKKRKAKR